MVWSCNNTSQLSSLYYNLFKETIYLAALLFLRGLVCVS
jgi:hypothetical protein